MRIGVSGRQRSRDIGATSINAFSVKTLKSLSLFSRFAFIFISVFIWSFAQLLGVCALATGSETEGEGEAIRMEYTQTLGRVVRRMHIGINLRFVVDFHEYDNGARTPQIWCASVSPCVCVRYSWLFAIGRIRLMLIKTGDELRAIDNVPQHTHTLTHTGSARHRPGRKT